MVAADNKGAVVHSVVEADDVPLLRTADATPHKLAAFTPCRSLADVRSLICGHSHAVAIMHALVQPEHRGTPSPGPATAEAYGLAGLYRADTGTPYWDLALRLAGVRDLIVVWQGNQHAARLLLAPDPLIDLVPRTLAEAPVEPGARLIPEALVRENLKTTLVELDALLAKAARPAGCRRIVVGTPPPLQDAEAIRWRMRRDSYFSQRARQMGFDLATARITPASIRRKFWVVLQELMAELAARHAAHFVPVPAEVFDAQGCLDPAFSTGDVTHANQAYALLLLRDIVARLH